MKKALLVLSVSFLCFSAFAQDSVKTAKPEEPAPQILNKRGHPMLPEARDWSIGFDANFIIDYFGNLFNNSTSNPGGRPNWLAPNTIIVKYMKKDRLAYIGEVRLGNVAATLNSPITDQNSTTSPPFMTTDTWKSDSMDIRLGAGFQKFRGRGRLQGIYGAVLELEYGRQKDTYTYGNPIDELHPVNGDTASTSPNTTFFGTGITGVANVQGDSRITESKSGTLFGVGVRGFIGIEYFVATKISIGAQYGWGIAFVTEGQGEYTAEMLNASGEKTTVNLKGPDASVFYMDTDNGQGQISLNFYF